jgi:hypothetical protein
LAEAFDWREQERRLNLLPHSAANVTGIAIHFLWRRTTRSASMAVPVTNG